MVSMVEPGYRGIVTPGWVRDPLWTAARAVPSLDLRFAANRSLRDAVTGRELVTFTRASSAAQINAAGAWDTVGNDAARFHHDPVTGQCLGLPVEEQRANLRTDSNAILAANSYGATNATLTSVSISTPLGGTTASLFALNVGANTGNSTDSFNFGSAITLANTTVYTQSIFVRMSGASVFRLRSNVTGEVFDITPSLGAPAPSGTITACTVQPFRDGWFRISWTFTSTTTAPGNRGDHWSIKSDVADGVGGYHIAGAQLEAGAFATSYIPTAGTAVTRAADIATLIGPPANNIRTIYLELQSPASGVRGIASLNDNSANNRWELSTSGTDPKSDVVVGGVSQASIDGGTVTANVTTKIAARISGSGYAISVNGGAEVTAAAGSVPVFDRLMLGRNQAGNYLNGPIARLIGWSDSLMALHQLTR